MAPNKSELEHIIEISKAISRVETQIENLQFAAVEHARTDIIAHNALTEELKKNNERLAVYNDQLDEHMRRTATLEKHVEKFEPLLNITAWFNVSLRAVAIVASVLGVLKLLNLI